MIPRKAKPDPVQGQPTKRPGVGTGQRAEGLPTLQLAEPTAVCSTPWAGKEQRKQETKEQVDQRRRDLVTWWSLLQAGFAAFGIKATETLF